MIRRGERPITVLEPSRGWRAVRLGELWEYRDLFWLLASRDVRVRYRQTSLGLAWTLVQPLATMVVFTFVFGQFAKIPSEGVPYPVFSFAALLPWVLFSGALQRAANSLIGNAALLTKVYFPRLVVPAAAVVPNLVDFGASLLVLAALLLGFHVRPTAGAFLVPLFTLLALLAALAAGLWLAALSTRYRDFQLVIPFVVQVGLFLSPVVYPASLVPPGAWRIVYGLNPMTLVIQGFRWGLAGGPPPTPEMLISIPVVAVLLVLAVVYFKRVEREFADVV